jgi:AcrR family transcriptional regulator
MTPLDPPKFRRRKEARPAEIVAAALAVFAEKGFAGAKLDEIAARAGVSKGAIYLYFATKEDVFRAVVDLAVAPNLGALRAMVAGHPGPFSDLARGFARMLGGVAQNTALGGVVKMVIGEARNFPQLARVWHDELVAHLVAALTAAIAAAQERGEVRAGDPRAYALQLISPLLMAVLWRETFVPVGAQPFDIPAVLAQHIETMLRGMSPEEVAP